MQFMDYFLSYLGIEQKKHESKKVSCAFVFLGFGQKLAEIFTSISSNNKNWSTRFSEFDVKIFFSYQNIKEFYFFKFLSLIF